MVDMKKFGTAAFTALLKTILMIFNIIFTALGIVFFAIGIYGMTSFKDFFSFAPSQTIYVPIICIGLFMFIVGALSLWCTPKGVTWLLYLYSAIVFVLFIAIMTLSVLFVVRRDTFEGTIKDGITYAIKNYPDNTAVDLLQSHGHCCGADNYTDWFGTKWANDQKNVPESCCKVDVKTCKHENISPTNATDINVNGCFKKMHDTIEDKYMLIGGIGFATSVVILFGSLLTCCLAGNLKKNRYEEVE